jgi:uncharacterized protein YbjT (DUF2867 family)
MAGVENQTLCTRIKEHSRQYGMEQMKSFLTTLALLGVILIEIAPVQAGDFLIVGATRNTGLEIAKILVARGDSVTALVRPTSNLENLEPLKVEYFVGDAIESDEVLKAVQSKKFDAVFSTLGGGRGEMPPDLVGTINIVDAMEKAGSRRLIVVTVIGPGKSIAMVPAEQRKLLGRVIALKEEAENYIMASSLNYTIVRPGQLTSNPRSGIIKLSEGTEPTGPVTRADLADLVVWTYDNAEAANKVYQVIGDDPLATQRMGAPG